MPQLSNQAILGVRLLGLLVFSLALWQMLANLVTSWRDFDPSYLGYFALSQLAHPAAGMFVGLLLIVLARPLGKCFSRNLGD